MNFQRKRKKKKGEQEAENNSKLSNAKILIYIV